MFKRAFSLFFLTYSFLAPAMAAPELNAGTVVDPINQIGQFTVSLPQTNTTSGIPALTQASADIFTTKGIPVIISTVAGSAPWWALTTGTGYLLLSQLDPSAYVSAISSGMGYAAGQELGSTGLMSSTLGKASQLALLATLISGSMLTANPLYSEAFMAAAQALGLQTALAISSQMMQPSSQEKKSCAQPSGIMNNIKVALQSGLADVLHVHAIAAFVSMLGACDTITIMRILLYEQAYRLALSGSAVAKKLFTQPATTETPKVETQPRKKERPIVTIM